VCCAVLCYTDGCEECVEEARMQKHGRCFRHVECIKVESEATTRKKKGNSRCEGV
jgi:hypothetical protein